jgi:DNA-binding NtrC family response regulator
MVRSGHFREDLYYRIHVVPIFVPALRERIEDIPMLAEYFVNVYCTANRVPVKRVADDAMQALKNYRWPGNVRELENTMQRLVLMTDEQTIRLQDLPTEMLTSTQGDSRTQLRWSS